MGKKKIKRYTSESVTEMLQTALRLSSQERFTNFTQLAKIQNVHRKTYLEQSRKYNGLDVVYTKIKKNLERNILIEIETGLISKNKGTLMLWNHNRK